MIMNVQPAPIINERPKANNKIIPIKTAKSPKRLINSILFIIALLSGSLEQRKKDKAGNDNDHQKKSENDESCCFTFFLHIFFANKLLIF